MKKRPGGRRKNPLEPLLCNHCDHRGLRYQGKKNLKEGFSKIYRCPSCGRYSSNPVSERKKVTEPVEMCLYHDAPKSFMSRMFRLQTMSWRVEQ